MKIPFQKIINDQDELNETENEWLNTISNENQLVIDVYEIADNLIIKSIVAGAKSEDITISLDNDVLTIKGNRRRNEFKNVEQYLYKECSWGVFSRTIILPKKIKSNNINATLEDGVLTIILPLKKIESGKIIKISEN